MASNMVKDQEYRRNRPSPTAEDWDLTARLSAMTAEEKADYIKDAGAKAYDNLFPTDQDDDSSKSGVESDKGEDKLQNRRTSPGPADQKSQRLSMHDGSQMSSTRGDKPGKGGRLSRRRTRRPKSRRHGASRSPRHNERSRSRSISRGGSVLSSQSSSSSADTRPNQPATGPASNLRALSTTNRPVTIEPVGPLCASFSPFPPANVVPSLSSILTQTPASTKMIGENFDSQLQSTEIRAAIRSLLPPTVFSAIPKQSPASDSIPAAGNYVDARGSSLSVNQISITDEMTRMVHSVLDGKNESEPVPSKPFSGSNTVNKTPRSTTVPTINVLASNSPILLSDDFQANTNENSLTASEHVGSEGNLESGSTAVKKTSCIQLEKLMQENREKWDESKGDISRLKDDLRRLDQEYDELEGHWVTQNQKERTAKDLEAKFGHLSNYITETKERMQQMDDLTNKAKNKVLVPEDVKAALKLYNVDLEEVGMELCFIKSSEFQSSSAQALKHTPDIALQGVQLVVSPDQSVILPGSLSGVMSADILTGYPPAVLSAAVSFGSTPSLKTAASLTPAILSTSCPLAPPPPDCEKSTDSKFAQDNQKGILSPDCAGGSYEAKDTTETSGRSSSSSSHKKHRGSKKHHHTTNKDISGEPAAAGHSRRHRRHKHKSKSKSKNLSPEKFDADGILSGSSTTRPESSGRDNENHENDHKTTGAS